MRISFHALIIDILAILAIAACHTGAKEPLATGGLAEIRADVGRDAQDITRVTVETATVSLELVANPDTGTFDGALLLPAGEQSLIARAFSDATQIGVSQPIIVTVQAGVITRVQIRILDTRDPASVYGPILDSLVYPTSVEAGASATFTISVVAPGGDAITYDWTSDCQGASFSSRHDATTAWSNATPGPCQIAVTASSNGISIQEAFSIVVFPVETATGAVDTTGVFVAAPVLHIDLPGLHCFVSPGNNASCPDTIASPDTTAYQISVISWGTSTPGSLVVSDNCAGSFSALRPHLDVLTGMWLPPPPRGLCTITARAVNGDGVAARLSAAVLVHAGGAPTTLFTGGIPVAVVVADVDGDGHPDLAVANDGDRTVSILLGRDGGGFQPRSDYPTGAHPNSVAMADVNGDNKPDVIVANLDDNTVSVLLGRGDGTLQAKVDYPTGSGPLSAAVADVNGDDKRDLVVVNENASTVSVFLGRGDGTFQAKVDYPTGRNPNSVAVVDVNGDGKPDLVAANFSDPTVSVLLGRGDGTFQVKVDSPIGSFSLAAAVADLSGDGKPDLIVLDNGSRTMRVLLGRGDGSFQLSAEYPTGDSPASITVANVNEDGRPDLVVPNSGDNTVSVLLGQGDGTFQARVDYPTGSVPVSAAVADVGGDGRPDLIVVNLGDDTVSVRYGKGGGSF